ncbi:T55 [Tupaiid betaherpesvirus 1]|uniref:Envelope glycoprotein B n=2 Tax=Betaherpesvirinae TaxID=10357 RepID=GB_TUHV2|nr:T55 [Tupaiid betaherpesvirus 1]Q9WRL5.1 RecName: Full=Envelope glycoprotein B; Short=gB; Flags: Precursor [Tupaiid herpesvirus 2]AAD42935.1 glycoprotein B [Tupaiid betaherpesvirus 1]AAK57104.1 T55 [Tupaiid betaherpesvirus 1]
MGPPPPLRRQRLLLPRPSRRRPPARLASGRRSSRPGSSWTWYATLIASLVWYPTVSSTTLEATVVSSTDGGATGQASGGGGGGAGDSTPSESPETSADTTVPRERVTGTEWVSNLTSERYPYRICSMSQGTDIVRFARTITCAPYDAKSVSTEGIMLIYKANIVPYTFDVFTYQKELFFQRSYAYIYTTYLLGNSREHVALPLWEVDAANIWNYCYSSYVRTIGTEQYVSYHQDSYRNETMWLIPEEYQSGNTRRYVTVKDQYHVYGSTWLYKETCSMNCIVTQTKAKSKYPYDYFALSSGLVVEASPFYDTVNGHTFHENRRKFHVREQYRMLERFGAVNAPVRVVPKMAFLERPDIVLAWEIKEPKNVTCHLALWETVNRAIRTEHATSFHFVSRGLTATFVTAKANETLYNNSRYDCIRDSANRTIDRVFREEYDGKYELDGDPVIFTTNGGLTVVWQGLRQKALAALSALAGIPGANGTTNHSRHRRDTAAIAAREHASDLTYAQLQFAYDTIRDYVNQAIGHIAEAWCLEQRRTGEMLHELSKINPSSMLTAIYDRPIAARLAGDVIALAKCVEVDQDTVQVQRDMRKFETSVDGTEEQGQFCYSRPVVLFRFVNSSETQYGQLGEDNEILLGTFRTEACQLPSLKIFVAGKVAYEYRDYLYKRQIDLDSIDVVNTMISLKVEPLENTDFQVLELYSRGELKSANVFDLEDIMREYNAHKLRLRYITSKIVNPIPPFMRGLDDFMSGLGAAGKGLGLVLGAVGGAVASVVGGFVSFFTNPFGSLTLIILVVAVVVIVFLLYQRQRSAVRQPLDFFFPYLAQQTQRHQQTVTTTEYLDSPPPYAERDSYKSGPPDPAAEGLGGSGALPGSSATAATKYTTEDAWQMLLAIRRLDEEKREVPTMVAPSARPPSQQGPGLLDRIRRRGYRRLRDTGSDSELA